MAGKKTAAELLIARGLVTDKKMAESYILSGQVYSGQQKIVTGGQRLAADAPLTVRGAQQPFASKGGYKLSGALRDFAISPAGRVCIDAGACTGGFTDCLLQHGAERVYAVDVGYGQLMGTLRQNARVINMERTNIGDQSLLTLSPRPDLGTVDLSYLSLRKGIPAFAGILHEQGELVCLVKPLFEVQDSQARRSGKMEEGMYAPVLRDLIADIDAMPFASVANLTYSPVRGNGGTVEFFLHVLLGSRTAGSRAWDNAIQHAVDSALALQPFDREREADVFEK